MGEMRLGVRAAWVACGVFLGILALAAPAVAQDFSLATTLLHPNARESNEDRFGSGVAFSRGTLFVGAKDEQGANSVSGVVHLFSDRDWSEVGQLKSSVDRDFEFGAAIQVDGERALISNMAIDDGVVWFFEKVEGAWTEKLRVQGLVDEAFGYRLALRGDLAFVAAPRVGTGNVHVFRRIAGTWGEVQVLTAADAQAGDFFGYSVAFDGQRLAISAPGSALGAARSGVYTFSRVGDAFVQDGKLAGDNPAAQWFGAEVAVNRDTLIVNAPPAYQATNRGKALVYERHGEEWDLDQELTVDGEASFPNGLAMDGDTAWFGASTTDPRSENVYAFKRTNAGWQQSQKLTFPEPGENEVASWGFQDGTFAIGFWNGLRTESVEVYRGPSQESSSGGVPPSGSAGAEAEAGSGGTGGTNVPVATGDGAAGSGPSSPASASAGRSANSETSDRSSCTLAPSGNHLAWPLALPALAFAIAKTRRLRRQRKGAVTRRRRTPAARSREARCGQHRYRSADSRPE